MRKAFELDDDLAGKPYLCPVCSEMHAAPPAAVARPLERAASKPRPARSRAAGVLVKSAALAAVVGVAVAGYVLYRPVSVRKKAGSHAAAARAAYEAGRFREALEAALRVEALVRENPSIFDEATAAGHVEKVTFHRDALAVYEEAEAAARGAAEDFAGAISTLDGLLRRARGRADPGDALYAAVESVRDGAILGEADRTIAEGGDPGDVLKRVVELRALLPGGAASKNVLLIEQKASAFVGAETTKLRAETGALLEKVLRLLAAGEFVGAKELLEGHKKGLARLPEELREPAVEEYRARMRALVEGRGEAAAGRFFELEGILKEALLAAESALVGPEAAAAELKDRRDKALALRGELGEVSSSAVEEIDACLREVGELGEFYEANRRKASRGDLAAFVVAASMDAARGSHEIGFRKARVQSGVAGVTVVFTVGGARVTLSAPGASFRKNMYLTVRGYRFKVPWSRWIGGYLLEATDLADRMRKAGVTPWRLDEWSIVEGPSFPLALGKDGHYFVGDELCRGEEPGKENRAALKEFRAAAEKLRDAIRDDDGIPLEIRHTLVPVVESSYGKTDPRDLLAPGFCRRAISEGYLERHAPEMVERHAAALGRYREAFESLGTAFPALVLRLKTGAAYAALRPIDSELERREGGTPGPTANDGSRRGYSWRRTDPRAGTTSFMTPLQRGSLYSVYHSSTYSGLHERPPEGATPLRAAVVHPVAGTIAIYDVSSGEFRAEAEKWNAAVAVDLSVLNNPAVGKPGWAFPPHVPIFDSRGTVVRLVTPRGVLETPDFGVEDASARRAAQDQYIDECARLLASPGELGLFFRYFTRYCLDSPIPSMPGLLGSHAAQGEMHQTVYEFLDRKLAGAFIGDCDDVAEFFQVVTRRQGKLSHIFSLPQHAACGFVERPARAGKEPGYALVFLQTGPTVIFEGESLDEVVENGIEFFSEGEDAYYTVASVPFLFRFAGEKTRTPYWLSDRILVDEPYAELLIRVQSYWHYHYYATGIRVMEEFLKTDKDISNFTELAGLYRRVHLFKQAVEMTRAGLRAMKRRDEKVRLKETMDIASFYHRLKEDEKAKLVLAEMGRVTTADLKAGRYQKIVRLMPVRLEAAMLYALMKEPFDAFDLIQTDIRISLSAQGKLIDPVRQAVLGMAVAIRDLEDEEKKFTARERATRDGLLNLLKKDFASNVFEKDDSFNDIIRNYSLLCSLAAALEGRESVRRRLLEAGPYPAGQRKHVRRGREITDDDWAWIRICPPAYWGEINHLTDPKDKDNYDPETALGLVEAMLRGVDAGRKLGSMNMTEDVILSAQVMRAAFHGDLDDFRKTLARVRGIASDRLTDDVAAEFGRRAGLVPLEEFPGWMDVFHEYVQDKQHYFHVAHVALANDHYEHALAAAERITGYFPDDKLMADEAVYMKGLAERLRRQNAEIERLTALRDEWRPLCEEMISLSKAGETVEAARAGEAALQLALKMGEEHPELVMTLEPLAELLAGQGRYDESLKHCDRLAVLWRKQGSLGDGSLKLLRRVTGAFEAAGRLQGAGKLRTGVVALARELYGGRSPQLAVALFNAAEFYDGAGAPASAEPLLREALAIDEKAFGKEHPEVAIDATRLARVCIKLGKLAEAEALYDRATAIVDGNSKAEPPLREQILTVGGRLRLRQNRYAEAEKLARRALGLTEKRLGPDHTEVADKLVVLADVLRDWKRYADAEPLYERAISIRRKVQTQGHPDLVKVLKSYAELLRQAGRADEAAKIEAQAREAQ